MKDRIPYWIRNQDCEQSYLLLKGLAFPCITFGKSIMLSENWVRLEVICENYLEEYLVYHNQLGLLHNEIYDAVAKMNLYGLESGKKALVPALVDAQKDGILLPFVENADYILPMLDNLRENTEIDSSYLTNLISVCKQYKLNSKLKNQNLTILTIREEEVLKLLAQGLTKKEIANHLYLSVSSIKRYIENIYQKLNVNNKQKAIIRARELKLL